MGLTQHANGTDLVTSLLNLMRACGMIGRWGAAMMPVRGQNNVQGASDVGAIPFVYTDYRSVKNPQIREEYARAWGVLPESLSLKEGLMVTEIVKEESGVRGMYIMGENPIISDPDIAHAEHWFRELEFLAVHDLFLTETARYADVVLPGSSFAEKTGTFVNTERRIQVAHQAVASPGAARSDLEILIELSNRLGLKTPHRTAEDVMREIVQVTPSWSGVTYDRLEGAGLDRREPTPIVEIHPADARALGVRDGDPVRLTSRRNTMVSSCRVSERVAPGQVFVPFHFREAAANLLTNPVLDPYAKMAELKCCAVRVEPAESAVLAD